ncbi:hypothetical protein [Gilvibacter sediminis]|uniref:hypothetical protein n=1 Tax=Gilvibacter sediminis TaxID=379071 RepID=UPI0023504882|nr:hypothetical protein [Gilvibacter sediminis]MDC7996681.1 hypothetical protein [Gilvibacter sediminis]
METQLIHFDFNAADVSSSVGNFTAKFKNSTPIPGPTIDGQATTALDLGTSGKGSVDLSTLDPSMSKFCLQITFKINAAVSSRQNIMECGFLPFALFADKGSRNNTFDLRSSLNFKKYGWRGADTQFKKELQINKWYTATLVYDYDTIGLFVDGKLVSVHGFPAGALKPGSTKRLFFGSWVDGSRFQMKGALLNFKWFDGIPVELESLLDEQRANAEWQITYKQASLHGKLNTGKRIGAIKYNVSVGSYTQFYQNCAIMFHESTGRAFEMHGSIYNRYKAMGSKAANLGYLITDEERATRTSGRKSLFSKGGIYWHGNTGAHPVMGEIYLEYENLGESKVLGFPKRAARSVTGGEEQVFEKARMYYKHGEAKAHEVHGAILAKYLAKGGVSKWGFPVSNESDVRKGRTVRGKFSEFEGCTIYWKSGIGAFEVHGDIRKKYKELGGPLGALGFPTSDEQNIQKVSGPGRINSFEKGCLNWYGSYSSICVVRPFKIRLQRIHTRESEGFGMGQNDIYFHVKIKNGARTLHQKRYPSSGDYGGRNVINPNKTFPVLITPKINDQYSFDINVRDSDPGNDDNLGRNVTMLTAANAWGYREPNQVFNQSYNKIKSIVWSIKPQINIASLSEKQKWWGFDNFRTSTISKAQYAAAFRDVDSETEWWDIGDGLKNLYYKWVVKGIASGGNCFGMSLEAIYARKNNSLLNQPLEDVVFNSASKNEINIKHTYQVGAGPIWWFVGQFLSGNTHDPKDVFNRTRDAFRRGNNPVLCVSQNYDFSGAPHCIMPYRWEKNGNDWKMWVMDPNKPGDTSLVVKVNAGNNTFRYKGSKTYSGGAWSGGRMHYMPFCVLDGDQRTPVWDAIMLLLSGTILILADDAETVSITDENGKSLDGNGPQAKQLLQAGSRPDDYFASFAGFDSGVNLKPGQLMMRTEKYKSSVASAIERINVPAMPLNIMARNSRVRGFTRRSLPSARILRDQIENRSALHVLNDPKTAAKLSPELKKKLTQITKSNSDRNFKHTVKGSKNGKLEYYIKSQFSTVKIDSTISKNEVNTIVTKDLNSNACSIDFKSAKAKNLNLEINNKLGINGDEITLALSNIPVQAMKSIKLNVKSGLTGIDLENSGAQTNLPVKIFGTLDGKKFDKQFRVPFNKALRIKPSTIIDTDGLAVSDISKLFGPITNSRIINKL